MWIPKGAALIRGLQLLEERWYFPQQKLKEKTCGFKFQIIDDATIAFLRFSISH